MANFSQLIKKIYPSAYDEVIQKISDITTISTDNRSTTEWYKDMIMYVTYPDSICSVSKSSDNKPNCDLNAIKNKIEHISDIGCNALHILPFFESPMIDMGFDVSDYLSVREDVGGKEAFKQLLKECEKYDIKVFADIVLNHCSYQHEWFQKAVSGDKYYRDYFIWTDKPPKLIKKFKDEKAVWARYELKGKEEDICIVFPEQVGDIPHWYKAEDGNYYYHTFYPHQIDINWNNPEVFVEFSKVLKYWAQKGLSFRLDAIPYLGKDILNGVVEDREMLHNIILALNKVVKSVNPDSVFLAEACMDMDEVKCYFGDEEPESELAYNFDLCRALWAALIGEETKYIWETLKNSYEEVPDWAAWVTFLRNHDELSFERMDPNLREKLYSMILPSGMCFREGFGVTGRTFTFLDDNKERLVMAYFLLFSLPGLPAIIYGDELGMGNDIEYMKSQTSKKIEESGDSSIADDTREINRGRVDKSDFKTTKAGYITKALSKIAKARRKYNISDRVPKEIDTVDGVLAGRYADFEFYINVTDDTKNLNIDNNREIIVDVNKVALSEEKIELGPYAGVWLSQ